MMIFQIKPKTIVKKGIKASKSGISPLLIVISILLLLLAMGCAMGFFSTLKDQKKPYSKIGVWFHVIGFTVLFSGLGLTSLGTQTNPQTFHAILVSLFLVLGILHVWFMYLFHPWSSSTSFLPELLFTGFVTSLGSLMFVLLFYFLDKDGYNLSFDTSILAFLVPFFIITAWNQWIRIPSKVYEGWNFPEYGRANVEHYRTLVAQHKMYINLVTSASLFEDHPKMYRSLRAVPAYNFGDFFHIFIQEQINNGKTFLHYARDPMNNPVEWVFFIEQDSWWNNKKIVRPDLSFKENEIKSGDTIIAQRVVDGRFEIKETKPTPDPKPQNQPKTRTAPKQIPSDDRPMIKIKRKNS